jgi:hypothetical protein
LEGLLKSPDSGTDADPQLLRNLPPRCPRRSQAADLK